MDTFSILKWEKKEAVFVVGVLVVLFGISFAQLKIGEMKTRDAQRKADVELVGRALDAYKKDFEVLPAATEDGKIVACGRDGMEICEWGGGPLIDAEEVVYLRKLPTEPAAYKEWKYVYTVSPDRKRYRIYIALEYKRDAAYKKGLTVACGSDVQCSWYVENK